MLRKKFPGNVFLSAYFTHPYFIHVFYIFLVAWNFLFSSLPQQLKFFLIIEPFISISATFGGVYFMWEGILWMKYIVVISGILMILKFTTSV